MSRRRTRRTNDTHAGDAAAIEASLADEPEPDFEPGDRLCPGPCNRTYLRRSRAAAAEIQAAHDEGDRDWNLRLVDHDIRPHAARPVWCKACQASIMTAIGRLPELAAALFEHTSGMADANVPAPVNVERHVAGHGWDLVGRLQWLLECGHVVRAHTVPAGPLLCAECLTVADVGIGRIAAGSSTDRVEKAKRIVSPSGSPAWDAVDELVSFAGELEVQLRVHLQQAGPGRSFRVGSAIVRATSLSSSVAYLATWSSALLSAPFAEKAGRDAVRLADRAEHAAGVDELVHRLPAPCPSCNRRALVREDGGAKVSCRGCGRSWTEVEYRRLTLVLAAEHHGEREPARPRKALASRRDGYGGAA